MLNFGPAIGRVLVDVRLAVRQDDNSLAVQMPVQALFQTFCSPLSGSILSLVGNTANQFTHVAENGLKFSSAPVQRGTLWVARSLPSCPTRDSRTRPTPPASYTCISPMNL